MVVMAVISLLSSIVLVSVKTARMNARNAKVRSDVHQIITALFLAREDDPNGKFPGDQTKWQCLKPSGGCYGTYVGNTTITDALAPYLPEIPKPPDPSNPFIKDAYLYHPNFTGWIDTSPPGAYIIWVKEGSPITDCQGYNKGKYDNKLDFYYCYQLIAPL